MKTFDTDEAFHEDGDVDSNIIVKDNDGIIWSGWCSEGGLWYVARARHEDETLGPDGDPWRPVGPVDLDDLPFPIEVFNVFEAFVKRVTDKTHDHTLVVAGKIGTRRLFRCSASNCDYDETDGKDVEDVEEEPGYQYGIDHRRSDIEVHDVEGEPFEEEVHVVNEFDEMGYGNARIVRRVMGPWEQAERDDDGEIVGWTPLVDWYDIPEVD